MLAPWHRLDGFNQVNIGRCSKKSCAKSQKSNSNQKNTSLSRMPKNEKDNPNSFPSSFLKQLGHPGRPLPVWLRHLSPQYCPVTRADSGKNPSKPKRIGEFDGPKIFLLSLLALFSSDFCLDHYEIGDIGVHPLDTRQCIERTPGSQTE